MGSLRRRATEEIVALNSVSFRVMPGEAFGVIGRNGAGKSTLMRVLARTLRPDSGKVVINGRASTLLQLGVGFNPQLSGRRNIYLGGLAAGMRKSEIDERFDEIVEFSELGHAINRPMKSYSSGMFSRLAFSVSMALDPDILLLDEIFAVGDEGFKEKSLETMQGVLERAGTIVFVSHALNKVAELCTRAMWLDEGSVVEIGNAKDVVDRYREDAHERRVRRQARRAGTMPGPDVAAASPQVSDRHVSATDLEPLTTRSAGVLKDSRLFVHIGLPKTGTTSLQAFLAHNSQALADQGILYPTVGRHNGPSHINLKLELGGEPRFDPEAGTWKDFLEVAATYPRSIVSSEGLSLVSQAAVEDLARRLSDINTSIVVYVRRQDELIQSVYAQMCKDGRTLSTFDEFLRTDGSDLKYRYADLLDPWAKSFGRDRIVVRPLEREQLIDGSIFSDFLATIGAQAGLAETLQKVPSRNASPSPYALAVIRALLEPRLSAGTFDRREFARTVGRIVVEADQAVESWQSGFRLMSGAQAREFLGLFSTQNERIAVDYLDRADGRLFVAEPYPDQQGGAVDVADLRHEDLIRLLDGVLSTLPSKRKP